MRIRFIALAAALLFGLGACSGSFTPGAPMTGSSHNGSGSASGMGGMGGGGGGGAGGGGY